MKRLGVIANTGKPRAADVLRRIARACRRSRLELVADTDTARLSDTVRGMALPRLLRSVDAVIALGGDGTMLRTARELDGLDIPLMGVNIGGLGFLTSISEGQLDRAMQCLATDHFTISRRTMADCIVRRSRRTLGSYRALNDVVIGGVTSRILTLDTSIGGDEGTSYVCDGMIIATPTGSTGHALSAGGPILAPDTAAFVISLICPHTLSSRPLVIPDGAGMEVTVADCGGGARLTVDGQVGRRLTRGDIVSVRRSDRHVRFIHLPDYSYFSVLRQKLHWSGSAMQSRARSTTARG